MARKLAEPHVSAFPKACDVKLGSRPEVSKLMKNWTRLALLWAACTLALALAAGTAFAAGSSYDANPLPGSTFQGADGNQDATPDAGGSGSTDWQSYAANSGVLHERLDQPVDGTGTLDYFYKGHESTPTDWVKDSVSGAITPAKSNALAQWSITDPLTSDVFFYFSFLRESTSNADSFYGIELFHDGHLWRNGNTNTDGTPTEIPCRSNGDLMISYEIDPANKNVAIKFYEWSNGAGPSNANPLLNCPEGATGSFVPANPAPSAAQAYMNFDGSITNYLNTAKFGNSISTGRFAEGAVDIDQALQTDLSDKPCFSFGYAQLHSRSSSSLASAMQDTIDPAPVQVANCTINIQKTVRVRTGGTESNPAPGGDTYGETASATVGDTLDYKFVVSVPSGSKSLQITDLHDVLGTATGDPSFCGTSNNGLPTSVASGGFNIGDSNQDGLVDPGEQWVYKCSYTTTSGDVARSPLHNTAFVTGRVPNCNLDLQYCGDQSSDDASANVGKATPQLSTTASNGSAGSEQTIGGTITDTATVSGGFNPTGSVTFRVYAPGDTTCATPLDWGDGDTSKTAALVGGQVTSPAFTTSAVGTYRWVASYSGDASNNSANGACNDPGEASLTKKATPSLATQGSNRVTAQTIGGTITDTATVSGGYSPTGSVTFRVYAPGDSGCATPLDWGNGDTSKTVALASGQATSPAFTTAAVGTYRWVASYSGDANNSSVSGACNDTDEFSLTKKDTPSLATQGSNRVTEQTIGGTITDTATVSGGFNPTGSVTFRVYAPGDTTCATPLDWGAGVTSQTVSLASGQATSPAFTTTAVGTYRWVASYSGDANNNTVSGACNDTDEFSLTKKASPAISTTASNGSTPLVVGAGSITDTATVGGGYNPTGTVDFVIYKSDSDPSKAVCDGTTKVGQDLGNALDGNLQASGEFMPTEPGTYYWIATYSGDANNNSVSGDCADASEISLVGKATPSLATEGSNRVDEQTIGGTITDTAHVTGGNNPTGSVTFKVYAPGDTSCGTPLDWGDGDTSKTVSLDGSGNATSPAFKTSAVGTYRWVASYSGDAGNNGVGGACNDDNEFSKTKKDTPSVTTQVSAAKIGLGHSVRDVATISGGYQPTGNVTFDVYGPVDANDSEPVCDETTFVTTLNGSPLSGGESRSDPFTPTQPGRYLFIAHYAGDASNNSASGTCNETNERVDVVSVAVTVQKDPNDTHAYDGDKVSFTITAKNTGTDSLANVELKDHIKGSTHTCETLSGPTGDDGNDQLDPGETWKWICTVTVVHSEENAQHQIVNLAHIEGDVVTTGDDTPNPSDHVVSNEDDASVPVFHPAIAIDKTGPATAQAGDKVAYVLTVTNPGDIGFAESTVKVADQQCNAEPVTLIGKSGDSSPSSLDPGDTWTYSCSVQTAVGDSAVHNTAGVTGCDRFGKCVDASDSADTTLTQPEQVVLPERVTPGTARLLGPTGCTARTFTARVRGSKIATVTFVLDGKVIKRVHNTKNASLIQLRVNPKKLRVGVHRLVVNVTYQSGTGTKPKTMRLSFQRCAKKLSAPRFTG
jgi:uncharacterized repeat protein (TIGR01451 family)